MIKCSHFASGAHRTASKAGVVPAQHRVASYSAQKTISPSLKHKNRPKMAGFSKSQRPMVLRLLTLQRSVHAADLIEASVPFAADDLWGDEGIFLKKVPAGLIGTTFTQPTIAGLYQGLAVGSPDSPSVHKHGVDLVPVTGQQLVPLTVIL